MKFCTVCQSFDCSDPVSEYHERWTTDVKDLAWCLACEQYEATFPISTSCEDQGYLYGALSGEGMAVIYDRSKAASWQLARREVGE